MNGVAVFFSDTDPSSLPIAASIGVGLICLYYLTVWLAAGRNPAPGPVVVRYDPPRGISPAMARYLLKKGFDEKCFTSALLNMAAKNYVEFEPQPGGYQLNRGRALETALCPDEKVLGALLLGPAVNIRLNADHRERISLAVRAMDQVLRRAAFPTYLREPRNLLLPGVLASAILIGILISFLNLEDSRMVWIGTVVAIFLGALCPVLVLYMSHVWRGRARGMDEIGISAGQTILITCLVVPFVVVEAMLLIVLGYITSPWFLGPLLLLSALVFLMHVALKARTSEGQKLVDEIAGFRQFLLSVEADRLSRTPRPQLTPELFEKLAPYAFALDVHEAWAEQFSDVSAANTAAIETLQSGTAGSTMTLDLSGFTVFVQRWFPFPLRELKISVGPLHRG
jgi:Predicted membrane protein (DUF2207) C-terminal domain